MKNANPDSGESVKTNRTSTGDLLIVDDTPFNLRLLSSILLKRGYRVRSAIDGPMALQTARTAPPDLILLDINMPQMDGYEVCQRLKEDQRTHDIPIIFISALDATEDKVKALTNGGVDYITKPFQVEEVVARVETQLSMRRLQRNLEAANIELAHRLAELQVRNEELDAFAHTAAHDLKGPMSAIIGFAEALESQSASMSPEELQKYHSIIARKGRTMINIIDELLLLAGVRQMEVEPETIQMGQIVDRAQERLADMIAEYEASLIAPDSWPLAIGYGPWIEEVWVNYISNALKYGGRPPRIELGGSLTIEGEARFWVQDNGAGLSPEEQRHLFTPFVRLDQTRAKGHGLGLSIVRRIVEKLGGQVAVESSGQPGEGSRFSFTLPTPN